MPENRVVAYALYNLAAANDRSDGSDATASRRSLADELSARETAVAQKLSREMAIPGNLLKALDRYLKRTGVGRQGKPAANFKAVMAPLSRNEDPYPARAAKVQGVTSCTTKCVNASCHSTYDDGRKVKFTAPLRWNPLESRFGFDPGPCN